jgi:hypothetical protein
MPAGGGIEEFEGDFLTSASGLGRRRNCNRSLWMLQECGKISRNAPISTRTQMSAPRPRRLFEDKLQIEKAEIHQFLVGGLQSYGNAE